MNLHEKARVEAFSDGVFAIALTLLILEIHMPRLAPGATSRDLLLELASLWPSFIAFLLSFFVVLVMWYTHHEVIALVRGVDRRFLFANGFLLLVVTFIPFPTQVLAEYLGTPARNGAVAFYSGAFFFVGLAFRVFYNTISRHRRLIRPQVSDTLLARICGAYTYGPLAYLVACAISFWSATLGLTICFSLWILWLSMDYRTGSNSRPVNSEDA